MISHSLPTTFYFLLFCGLIAANVSIYKIIFAPRALEVTVLDVGKGEATLVQTSSGKTLLIDTGPDASILRALGKELPMWQRRIDAVILTGTKASLVGGLPEVESRYRVPAPVRVGDTIAPYGMSFIFDNSRIEIIAPATFAISYGSTSLNISSSTPSGTYISNGQTIKH
jgi:glyoxylase-like metal-dependent hydrolase (beta-lactamase superfamily II)